MPARSFIGIGILIGLIGGAFVGLQIGNVAITLAAGVILGGGIGFAIDRLRSPGKGE